MASVMLGLTLAGGTTLLVQVTGVIVGSLIVWSILRRLMRGSPRDTSPLKQRTRQIDPALSMQFRPDDWRGT